MSKPDREALDVLARNIRLAALSLKLDVVVAILERRYRSDQPRAPRGIPTGGQWVGAERVPDTPRMHTALAATLLSERVGLGDAGLVRHCIYVDMLGRMRTIELNAMVPCRPTYPAAP
jgi:hypothetical protein